MSQQGLRQASVRAVSGTTLTYEGDWHDMWDGQSIATGTFNERMLRYINQKLGTSYVEINGAMQALALDQGATNFGSMGTFNAALTASTGASILLGSETNGLAFSASDDSMEIRDTVTPANNYVGSTITKFGAVRASAGYYYNSSGVLTSSASGLRRDYDPRVTGPKYLCEAAATNEVRDSGNVSGATWNLAGGSVTWSSTSVPDGTSAVALATNAGGILSFYHQFTGTSAPWTASIFAKAGTLTSFAAGLDGTYAGISFDLLAGTVSGPSTGHVGSIIPLVNGWYRCIVTRTQTAGANYFSIQVGGTAGTIYFWGGQAELGSAATSYIPTTSATVTRAVDVIPAMLTSAIPYSATVGTLYHKFMTPTFVPSNVQVLSMFWDGTDNERIMLFCTNNGPTGGLQIDDGGVAQATFAITNSYTTHKVALAWAVNNVRGAKDGALIGVDDTAATLPTVTSWRIGSHGTFTWPLAGWMFETMYVKRRMTNAEITTVTTP